MTILNKVTLLATFGLASAEMDNSSSFFSLNEQVLGALYSQPTDSKMIELPLERSTSELPSPNHSKKPMAGASRKLRQMRMKSLNGKLNLYIYPHHRRISL